MKKMPHLKSFYFTFGTDENFPFRGGWIVIHAPSIIAAKKIFMQYFPDEHGYLNCSHVYTAEEFKKTNMFREHSNHGASLHWAIGPYISDWNEPEETV